MEFKYTGVFKGNQVSDNISARSKEEAKRILQRRGVSSIFVDEIPQAQKSLSGGSSISTRELAVFFRQLSAFEKAGEPISRSLNTLVGQVKNPKLKIAIENIKKSIDRGTSIADAFDEQKAFPLVCINLIRVGEVSGGLEQTLVELANYLKQLDDIERGAKEALFYPKIVITVLGIALFYILYAVLPDYKNFYDDMGIDLPLATKMMFNFSVFLNEYWMISFPALFGFMYILKNFRKIAPSLYDRLIIRIPIAKGIVKNMIMFRFVKTLYVLVSRGVEPLTALKLTSQVVDNSLYEEAIMKARDHVRNGVSISESLKRSDQHQVIDFMAISFIQTGEETGNLDDLLEKASTFYHQSLTDEISAFSKSIEPLLLIPVGIFMAVLVMSTYMPVFRMIQIVKH